jgi:hypothetical protein
MLSRDTEAEAGRRLKASLSEELERRAAALGDSLQERVERRGAAAELAGRAVRDEVAAVRDEVAAVQRDVAAVRREAVAAKSGAEAAAAGAQRALERLSAVEARGGEGAGDVPARVAEAQRGADAASAAVHALGQRVNAMAAAMTTGAGGTDTDAVSRCMGKLGEQVKRLGEGLDALQAEQAGLSDRSRDTAAAVRRLEGAVRPLETHRGAAYASESAVTASQEQVHTLRWSGSHAAANADLDRA